MTMFGVTLQVNFIMTGQATTQIEMGWLGSQQTQNLSQARRGLESKLDIQAELGLGPEKSWISKLGSASAWT